MCAARPELLLGTREERLESREQVTRDRGAVRIADYEPPQRAVDPRRAPESGERLDGLHNARRETLGAEYDRLAMAYDEELADRIRELVGDESALTEKKMFGGLAFLVGGNMAVAASGQGGLLVRVDPAEADALIEATPARAMEMRGRAMTGWLRLDSTDVKTKQDLSAWVARGVSFARSLPAK